MGRNRNKKKEDWRPSAIAARARRIPSGSRDRPIPLLDFSREFSGRMGGRRTLHEAYPSIFGEVAGSSAAVNDGQDEMEGESVGSDGPSLEEFSDVGDEGADMEDVEDSMEDNSDPQGAHGWTQEGNLNPEAPEGEDREEQLFSGIQEEVDWYEDDSEEEVHVDRMEYGNPRYYNTDSDPVEDFLSGRRGGRDEDLLLPYQDPLSSLDVARASSLMPDNLQFRLLRLLIDGNVTRKFTSQLLTLLKPEVKYLPKDYRVLWKTVPIEKLSMWIVHICLSCEKKWSDIYKFGQRSRVVDFSNCEHRSLNYNMDYYIVADVAEVLAVVLPSVWKWRNRALLPPHIEEMMEENRMDFATDITLTLSSDGAQVFTSGGLSVWPVMAIIDGIPFHVQRYSIFELGILCAREEAKNFLVNSMLEDVLKQVQRLNKHPFSWLWDGREMKSRVLISRVVADAPARSVMQGLNMCRAAYGCSYCYQKAAKGYFPHQGTEMIMRTDHCFRDMYAREFIRDRPKAEARYGVKWESEFIRLPFDLVLGFPPDIMHCGYLGVMKLLMEQWISKPGMIPVEDAEDAQDSQDSQDSQDTNDGNHTNKKRKKKKKTVKKTQKTTHAPREVYQLENRQLNIINSRLVNILPPERTTRKPQEIGKVGQWKAHELSMFLLYYGPVVLDSVLPKEHYDHFIDLVAGISLLSTKITAENVARAQEHLDRFSGNMLGLYNEKCQRYNVHVLRHLPEFCRRHGILPLFSMYIFETENHKLVKYVKGPVGVGLQMMRKAMTSLMVKSTPDAFDKHSLPHARLEWEVPRGNISSQVRNYQTVTDDGLFFAVYKPAGGKPRIVSKDYTPLTTRKSYVVMMENGNVGVIHRYFSARGTREIWALVEELEVSQHPILSHIFYKQSSLGMAMVNVKDIKEQVIEIASGEFTAYCLYLNSIEHVAE